MVEVANEYREWRKVLDPRVNTHAHLKLSGTPVFVISVRESPRRSKLESAAKACGFPNGQIKFVDAVDGRRLQCRGKRNRRSQLTNTYKGPGLTIMDRGVVKCSPVEIACSASHVMAVHAASEAGLERVIICEDDVHSGALAAWELCLEDVISKAPTEWHGLSLFRSSLLPKIAEFAVWSDVVSHNWGVARYCA